MHTSLELNEFSLVELERDDLDLIALQYLAHRLRATLNRLEEHGRYITPLIYHWKEPHQRVHRVVLYKNPSAFREQSLSFVGFLSKKQSLIPPTINHDIVSIDKVLVAELAANSWLLSYSSMELADGNWCNLVVFNHSNAKAHIKSGSAHMHAAYQLAPHYYEWIRLHNGIMNAGLEQEQLMIRSTKYYTFHQQTSAPQGSPHEILQPSIRERHYAEQERKTADGSTTV